MAHHRAVFSGTALLCVICAVLLGLSLAGIVWVLARVCSSGLLAMLLFWALLLASSAYILRWKATSLRYDWRLGLQQLVADYRILLTFGVLHALLVFLYAVVDKKPLLDKRFFVINYLLVKVPVAFVEEVFFRGALDVALSDFVQPSFGAVLTSVTFAVAHVRQLSGTSGWLLLLKMASLLAIFLFAYIAASRYQRQRNLAYSTLWHCWMPVEECLLAKMVASILP